MPGLHPGEVAHAARDGHQPEAHDPAVGARVELEVEGAEYPRGLQGSDPITSHRLARARGTLCLGLVHLRLLHTISSVAL